MKKLYIKPKYTIIKIDQCGLLQSSKYNDVGNFGFGDDDDDDREGDDNWDHDWSGWND